MENTCIKVLSVEHGKKVIEYYKSLGVDTYGWEGFSVHNYYGVFNGIFDYFNEPRNSEVIKLPLFQIGEYVYKNIDEPLIIRQYFKEQVLAEGVFDELNGYSNFHLFKENEIKKYSDYVPEPIINKTKIIDKVILCYYIDITHIRNGDIQKYVDDIRKMFGEKNDDSVIQYFIPVKSETRIECIYSPNDKELKDLNNKIEELNNYIKNNK